VNGGSIESNWVVCATVAKQNEAGELCDMGLIFHIAILAFAVVVITATVLFAVIDTFGRVDYLKDNFPWLSRILEKRSAVGVLLLSAIFLVVGDGLELIGKEVPEVPSLPAFIVKAPLPPIIQVRVVAAPIESKNSLRRRTMHLADEVYQFVVERVQHHPPSAYPDSSDPNPSAERKQAIKLSQEYDQETQNQYMRRYRDRMIGIVREYDAKGVRTRYLENDFKQRVPGIAFIGSDWENSPMDELSQFRDLAYHVDASDNAIHISD
jgi:hypothetical protein